MQEEVVYFKRSLLRNQRNESQLILGWQYLFSMQRF